MLIDVTLPWPPSVNHTYARRGNGKGVRLTDAAKTFRWQVLLAVKKAKADRQLSADVAVTLWISPPDRRKRDIDNLLKATLDALTAARVWCDDQQVVELHLLRQQPQTGGQLRCFIAELSPRTKPQEAA